MFSYLNILLFMWATIRVLTIKRLNLTFHCIIIALLINLLVKLGQIVSLLAWMTIRSSSSKILLTWSLLLSHFPLSFLTFLGFVFLLICIYSPMWNCNKRVFSNWFATFFRFNSTGASVLPEMLSALFLAVTMKIVKKVRWSDCRK